MIMDRDEAGKIAKRNLKMRWESIFSWRRAIARNMPLDDLTRKLDLPDRQVIKVPEP
jgi:hypothetical protein